MENKRTPYPSDLTDYQMNFLRGRQFIHAAFEKLNRPQPPEFPHVFTFASLCFHMKQHNFFGKSL